MLPMDTLTNERAVQGNYVTDTYVAATHLSVNRCDTPGWHKHSNGPNLTFLKPDTELRNPTPVYLTFNT